jgi:tetratricopeptide (TPR) repeat protein
MYLPSLGFVLVAGYLIAELGRRQRYLAVGLVLVILGFYGWRSVDRNRDWRSHESLWTVTLRQNPGSAVGWLGMGEVHLAKGESEQAELAYKRSWELRDGIGYFYPEAHNRYAYMLRQRGDLAGAEQHFRQVLSRDPRQPIALMNLGELLFRDASSRPEAIDLLQRAIAETPGDFRCYVNLAQAYKLDGNFGPALEAIDKAIALSPDEAAPWNVKADILRLAGRMQEAQQARQQARRLRGRG